MTKKPCDGCPENKCRKCPVAEEIEQAVLKSQANFGAPEELWIEDPDTKETIYINMSNPSDRAMVLLNKIFKEK